MPRAMGSRCSTCDTRRRVYHAPTRDARNRATSHEDRAHQAGGGRERQHAQQAVDALLIITPDITAET